MVGRENCARKPERLARRRVRAAHTEMELVLEEKKTYADLSALDDTPPAAVVQGPSGWVYHSTALGEAPPPLLHPFRPLAPVPSSSHHQRSIACHRCVTGWFRPHHCLRRLAIRLVETSCFDPFVLTAIMCVRALASNRAPCTAHRNCGGPFRKRTTSLTARSCRSCATRSRDLPRRCQRCHCRALHAAVGLYMSA